jgi:hypothetical protein
MKPGKGALVPIATGFIVLGKPGVGNPRVRRPPILIFSEHAFLVEIGPTARHRRLGMAKNL